MKWRDFWRWAFFPVNLVLWRFMAAQGLMLFGGGKGDEPPPPDFGPLASASQYAADKASQLGEDQLAAAKDQFTQNMAVTKPVTDAQVKLMGQAYDQGNQNYQTFQTEGRPIQQTLRDIANGVVPAKDQQLQDEAAATAIADSRTGTTQQMNQLFRQGQRYGMTPSQLAAQGSAGAVAAASNEAALANGARTQAANQYYARLGDVYNTYAGLGSNAPNFYNAGTQAGNSAVSNQNGTSGQLMNGLAQGTSTIVAGNGQQLQGLGQILNSQTSSFNAGLSNQGQDSIGGILGGVGGLALGVGKSGLGFSDRRLKENVKLVSHDERTGLNLYTFNYKAVPNKRYIGVMADEVEHVHPDAVYVVRGGYQVVDYHKLGLEMKEVA